MATVTETFKVDPTTTVTLEELLRRAQTVHKCPAGAIQFDPSFDSSRLTTEDVAGVPGAFQIHNILTADECDQFIKVTEELGYTDAPISTGLFSAAMMKDVRDNMRVMWEVDQTTLGTIYNRAKDKLPQKLGNWSICGLNERFRFYRYDVEQQFRPHYDGCFPRNATERSRLTFIIYLNDDFEGGYTTFFISRKEYRVSPRKGTALVFHHVGPYSPLHEGSPHTSPGKFKYVLRSDVMYTLQLE